MNKFFKIAAVLLIVPFALTACDMPVAQPSAQQVEQKAAQTQQSQFNKTTPIPVLSMSQERENLAKRATRINVQNMSGCANVFQAGVLIASYVVAGKVSSLNSYMLAGEQIIKDPFGYGDTKAGIVIEQPDIDGAYGANAEGVFFFTADSDAYTEVIGDATIVYSDECRAATSSPLLVQNTNEE